jgi:hypothetical protein
VGEAMKIIWLLIDAGNSSMMHAQPSDAASGDEWLNIPPPAAVSLS